MRSRSLLFTAGLSFLLIASGCQKKVALKTPPPAPQANRESRAAAPPQSQRQAVSAVTATPARSAPVVAAATEKSLEDLLNQLLDAYFDYDNANLRKDAQTTLNRNSETLRPLLRQFPRTKFVVEGDCDERGSAEYNLALGDRRAKVATEFLNQIGISGERLSTISYGKERPICAEHSEDCWQKNRRVHLSASR